jgi:UDP-glucose:(heptosyl)LPS alpha-1,3-glucosyltransferase
MRVAFGIEKLFAGGGLQRDCVDIAKLLVERGHEVVIYAARAHSNTVAEDIPVVVLKNSAWTNHQRLRKFSVDFLRESASGFDLTVGFNKLSGLDVLYCADASTYHRVIKRPYLRLLPRYRVYAGLEKDSFERYQTTTVILLSQNQLIEYRSAWTTELERLHLVPPTLSAARRSPQYRLDGTRQKLRSQLGIKEECVWIAIGVQPKTKGFDRIIQALPRYPNARLLIVGVGETSKPAANLATQARKLGVSSRVNLLGHREDITQLMAAADLLVHPARYDTTGTVILEAVVNGLPVVTTAACGYAAHVEAAQAGVVVKEPFDFRLFLAALDEAQESVRQQSWSKAGVEFGQSGTLYEGKLRAAEIILHEARIRCHTETTVAPEQHYSSNIIEYSNIKKLHVI